MLKVLSLQMIRSVLLFLICGVVHCDAVETLSSKTCIQACSFIDGNEEVCHQCAKSPPITYNMCEFACEHSHGLYDLILICRKCLKNKQMLKDICFFQCDITALVNNKQLCRMCAQYENNK